MRHGVDATQSMRAGVTDRATRLLADDAATRALGHAVGSNLRPGMVLYLRGDLGAGKTTFARGVLSALGFSGKVKSPTFSLLESYELSSLYLYHFDFYRFDETGIADPAKRDAAWAGSGFRECFGRQAICLVEWPERAGSGLPAADLTLELTPHERGRNAVLQAYTEAGKRCLDLPPDG